VIMALFATAPHQGEFWWSDAPRHALNGAFLRDLLLDHPIAQAKQWAIDYYLQYPALTILFYPPALPSAEAPFFLIFGVSHLAAITTIMLFYAGLALGAFRLVRRWLGPWPAAACTILLIGAPEIALWGRQVMLEIPAYALMVWAIVFCYRYVETGRPRALHAAFFVFWLALYTKQSVIFVAPAIALLLWHETGAALLRRRHVWLGAIAFAIGLVPLAWLTLNFGQGNLQSVVGIQDAQVSRLSIAGWIFYLRLLPQQIGWLPCLLALCYVAAACVMPGLRLPRRDSLFLLAWFAIGYLFFSAIDLKEARHTVFLLLPVAVAAILGLAALCRALRAGLAAAVLLVFAGASFANTLLFHPVPRIEGYREAATWIHENAPAATVVFSGQRDGSFIFNLRALDPQRQMTVIRADKLLLNIAIRRELGVTEKTIDPAAIGPMLNRYGVSYVVAERDFWTDLTVMAAFQATLDSSQFEEVKRIVITANVPHLDRELRIYRNRAPLAEHPARLRLDLPTINQSFEGEIRSPAAPTGGSGQR
jgi:4-amino-4-deoxy-L-arabinose transferase-like glycosyltransferase